MCRQMHIGAEAGAGLREVVKTIPYHAGGEFDSQKIAQGAEAGIIVDTDGRVIGWIPIRNTAYVQKHKTLEEKLTSGPAMRSARNCEATPRAISVVVRVKRCSSASNVSSRKRTQTHTHTHTDHVATRATFDPTHAPTHTRIHAYTRTITQQYCITPQVITVAHGSMLVRARTLH